MVLIQSKKKREPSTELLEREAVWLRIIRNWNDWKTTKADKLQRYVEEGIPDSLRRRAW